MSPERAQQIVDALVGTCDSIAQHLEDGEDEHDPILTSAIDEQIFYCQVCNWWCGISEMLEDRDMVCDDHLGEDE